MRALLPALAIAIACGCASTESQVDAIVGDAQIELRRGRVAAAQHLAERGAALTQSTPQSAAAWKVRLLDTDVRIARLEYDDALKDLEAAPPDGAQFQRLRARRLYQRAVIQVARGQLKPGLTSLAAAEAEAADDAELRLDIEILSSQARLRLGQWDDAEQRLRGVLKVASDRGDRYRSAAAINNLGMSRIIRNRFDDALPHFEQVLSYTDLEQTRIYAASLNNAGICHARLGQFDKALAFQQRAVEMYERSGRKLELMTALGEIGTTHLLRDDLERGVSFLQRALAIANEGGLANDGALWARNLAAAYVMLGDWNEAEKYSSEARRLNPPDRAAKLVFNTATEAQVAAARGQHRDAARLFNEVLANSASEPSLVWVAHEGLAKLAVAAGQTSTAAEHFEAALATIERTRSALLKTDYRLSFLTRLIRFYRSYVDFLVDSGHPERALAVADSSRARVLAERLGVAAPTRGSTTLFRRRAAEDQQVFLVYWLAPQRSLAWVVSKAGVRHVALPARDAIEPLVNKHLAAVHNTLADPLAGTDSAGDQLYAQLIAPIAAAIPRGSRVVIVPDGALHRLNFETLPVRTGGTARYWIEDVTIQIAPSLAMMVNPSARAREQSLLLVGDPTPRAPDFPALTYAAAEMDGVTKQFGGVPVTRLTAERASPAAFREARPERFSTIHFTSHAVANPESPMDSAVILSGPDNAFKLYARDVAEMPLNADLVTVSACRSAGERAYSGEGLVGFAWAFLRAGSRRVVAGLWDVDDRSTAVLMEQFYARLAARDQPAAALRAAKLSMVRQGLRPYYWGSLQMFTAAP